MTAPRRSPRTLPAALLLTVVAALLSPVPAAQAATNSYLCTGYAGCSAAGYSNFGYRKAGSTMWWRMYTGHNCTNYVAYRLVKRGMSAERPWSGTGMAYYWGRARKDITDDNPMVGSVAWWNSGHGGVGASGHVAYVQQVISRRKIVISEDSWGGDFHWRVITKDSGRWPTGFVHFMDEDVRMRQAPAVSGTPAVGASLALDTGEWRPAATYAVQWLADGVPVAGATTGSFTPGPELVGKSLSARVTATVRGYLPGTSTTTATAPVEPGTMAVSEAPTLTGTPRVDQVLTVRPGATAPTATSTEIRWFADGSRIPGAGGTTLRLGQDMIDQRITARVIARRAGYRALSAESPATAPVEAGTIEVTRPFGITGPARLDHTLSVEPGGWTPKDAVPTYTWLRDGAPVAGATGPGYRATLEDVGHRLAVRVDLRRASYRNATVTVPAATVVTTVPRLQVRTVGRVRRAVVRLQVAAPGVPAPGGIASVRLGRARPVTAEVVDGALRVVFRNVRRAGTRPVRVRYLGTEVVLPARARTEVEVRRPRTE